MIEERETLERVAICGTDKPFGAVLKAKFAELGIEVLSLGDDDLRQPAPTLGEKMNGVDGIIDLYGEPYVARWKGRYEFDIYRSRLMAIRSLGTAMLYMQKPPKFFITVSNAMVYDPIEVHDEYSMSYGDTLMSEVGQMETKETMKVSHSTGNVRVIIARMGYLMCSTGGAYPMLYRLAKIGWGGSVDDGYQCIPMIYEQDAVNAIIHLSENKTCQGIYNLTLPEMASMNELVSAFSHVVGKSQHRLPKCLIKLFAGRAFNLLQQNCKVVPSRLLSEEFKFDCRNVFDIVHHLSNQ